MESSPDLAEQVLGMVRATFTRVVGPDGLQASEQTVRVVGEGTPTPTLEMSVRAGGRTAARRLVIPPEPSLVSLEATVNDALLPLLTELRLLPPQDVPVDDPPLGQRPADTR
jgi:hypothetical protein